MSIESSDKDELDQPVEDALAALQVAIANRVSAEQQRDQLTGLPNGTARDEWLRDAIEDAGEHSFWIAFVEVDKFKSVNDEFGYDSADLFLKYVASELRTARNSLPEGTAPFRPHGDEFFLAGPMLDNEPDQALAQIGTALESLRAEIAQLRVPCALSEGGIQATVSIGWVCSEDIVELEPRSVLTALECAVQRAKFLGRNQVVRFEEQMRKAETVDARADCSGCGTKFSLVMQLSERRPDDLWCPTCGQRVARPHSLLPPPPT